KKSITSVAPVVFFSALQELYLYDNLVQDAQPVSRLRNLRKLNLSSNRLSAIPRLDSSGLEQLFLADNRISSVVNLSNLSRLQSLSVKGNRIVDPSPVAGIATLSSPDLRNNEIATVGHATSILPRQPYLKDNPVCRLLIHLPDLNAACRREPLSLILLHEIHLREPRIILNPGILTPVNP
ncbi:MAG: leucine-rich repeat domain-containing protein, partial [Thermoanaerobaculia bacterium]|nr:leucine-rich repeat domain-containing protein [Thermoanaerobaculia bacterium]